MVDPLAQYAYVDESGDPNMSLDKAGTSRFYVICAVLVDGRDSSSLTNELELIRAEFFGAGEMKSSAVGNNTIRRQQILARIVATGLRFYSVVVDKSQISPDAKGLRYKKSFIKYINGQLYKRLYHSCRNLQVYADQHGHPEFMESFSKYLKDRYQDHLLERQTYVQVESGSEVAVQAADMIAGSLFRIYSEKDSRDLLQDLSGAAILIERWPPDASTPDVLGSLSENERYDHLVAEHGVLLARNYVITHEDIDHPEEEARVEALKYLLYRYELSPSAYIERQMILNHVNEIRDDPLSMQAFSSNVIGRLRSEGVIIASSNQGCKIPCCTKDMFEYVSLVDGQSMPYIGRLAVAREHLLLASSGAYDIVGQKMFPQLYKCMDALSD